MKVGYMVLENKKQQGNLFLIYYLMYYITLSKLNHTLWVNYK